MSELDRVVHELDKDMTKARANWEDAVAHSLRVIADTAYASDKAILEVVNNLVKKVLELQHRVDLLEDLHRLKRTSSMTLLHESSRVDTRDTYFICGGNPDGNGGGVIASVSTLEAAHRLQRQAIMQGYTRVRVWTWAEMNDETLHRD